MRKLFFSVVMVLLVFSNAKGQEKAAEVEKPLRFGAKAGLNISTWVGDSTSELGSRTGMYVGGFVNYKLSDRFALQPELLFSQQGAADGVIVNEVRVDYAVNYLNIPVMVKFYATKGLSFEAGPQIGFNVHDEVKIKDGNTGDIERIDIDIKDMDFGINAGVGYSFDMGLGIDFRYNLGLAHVIETIDARSSVVSFGLNYQF